jgi:hypothetical protein
MRRHATAALAAIVVLGAAACTAGGERALKDSRPELMRELKAALTKSNIPFREDAEGFIRYSSKDEQSVSRIRETLQKELTAGVVWKLEDPESRDYLLALLGSKDVKCILESRKDGEWVRWYPLNEEQEREIGLKLAEHRSELKQRQAASGAK